MDVTAKPFVPRQQQSLPQPSIPPQSSYNVYAPTFVHSSSTTQSHPSLPSFPLQDSLATPSSTPLESQALDILCDIFSDVDANVLKATLLSKDNDLQATILTLTDMLDQSSSLMLDGIWKDHLEEYEELESIHGKDVYDESIEEYEEESGEKKNGQISSAAAGFQPVFMFHSSTSQPTSIPNTTKSTNTQTKTNQQSNHTNTKSSFSTSTSPLKPVGTSAAKSTSTKSPRAVQQEEQVVCKYFLAGQCYRKDCMYLHTTTVCRYWKLGTCSRGDTCIYMHADEEPSKPQKPTTTSHKPPPPPYTSQPKQEEIPKATTSTTTRPPAYLKADMAANIKLKQLQTLFHHVEPGNVKAVFYNCNFQVDSATEQISKLYGKPRVAEAPSAPVKSTVFKPAPRKPKQWVETGEEVAQLYSECREEAIKHATARNTCFQFATTRYLAGDGLAAKEWSKKGRYHDEMMRKLHHEACMRILATRNKDLASEMILDLHGLHKRETIEVLQQKIAFFKKANANRHSGEPPVRVFYVIVGTGHHSSFGKSLIGRAVQEYLDSEGIRYTDCSDDNRGGMLTVYIK